MGISAPFLEPGELNGGNQTRTEREEGGEVQYLRRREKHVATHPDFFSSPSFFFLFFFGSASPLLSSGHGATPSQALLLFVFHGLVEREREEEANQRLFTVVTSFRLFNHGEDNGKCQNFQRLLYLITVHRIQHGEEKKGDRDR